jgi:hypothetical protein
MLRDEKKIYFPQYNINRLVYITDIKIGHWAERTGCFDKTIYASSYRVNGDCFGFFCFKYPS